MKKLNYYYFVRAYNYNIINMIHTCCTLLNMKFKILKGISLKLNAILYREYPPVMIRLVNRLILVRQKDYGYFTVSP